MAWNRTNLTGCSDDMGISQENVYSSYPEAAKIVVQFSPRLATFLLVINIVITILTILGNLTVISTVVFYRQLRVPANLFISSLAVADLLVGLVLQPKFTRLIVDAFNNTVFCSPGYAIVVQAVGFITLTASLTNLSLITLDKYIAITHPLRYVVIVSDLRVKVAVTLGWVCSILFGIGVPVSSLVLGKVTRVLWYAYLLFVCTFTISLYVKLYRISKIHASKIQAEAKSVNTKVDTRIERHGMKTVAMVATALGLSSIPYIVTRIVIRMRELPKMDQNELHRVECARLFSLTFLLSNSTANPFIYFFRSKKLRFYSWKMFKTLTSKIFDR